MVNLTFATGPIRSGRFRMCGKSPLRIVPQRTARLFSQQAILQ